MLSHICIVRKDLPTGLLAANLVHAAGESSPGTLPKETRAVALIARDEPHLRAIAQELESVSVPHHRVEEDDEMFAIGIRPAEDLSAIRKVTSSLGLVR